MEIIYTNQKTGFEKGKKYANPRFFDGRPKQGVTKATIIGNWPAVEAAYRSAGVDVDVIGGKPRVGAPVPMPAPQGDRDEGPAVIPDDFRDLAWPALRRLASSVSAIPVLNKDEAIAAVEAELVRRAEG